MTLRFVEVWRNRPSLLAILNAREPKETRRRRIAEVDGVA